MKRMDEGAKHTLPNMADRHTFTIACYDTTDTLVEVLETTFMPVVVQGHLSKVRVWLILFYLKEFTPEASRIQIIHPNISLFFR